MSFIVSSINDLEELSAAGKAAVIDAIRKLPPPPTGDDPARRLKFTQRE